MIYWGILVIAAQRRPCSSPRTAAGESGPSQSAGPARLTNAKIVSTTINNGKPIVLGTEYARPVTVPVVTEIFDDSGGVADHRRPAAES